MEIKLYTNNNAKNIITKTIETLNLESDVDSDIIYRWLSETRTVKCYMLVDKINTVSIVLLSKCDFDPDRKHRDPYILDYIYTFDKYRRNNYAYKILLYLKNKEQTTSFCDSLESENLFRKANYIYNGYDKITKSIPMFRYP